MIVAVIVNIALYCRGDGKDAIMIRDEHNNDDPPIWYVMAWHGIA